MFTTFVLCYITERNQ